VACWSRRSATIVDVARYRRVSLPFPPVIGDRFRGASCTERRGVNGASHLQTLERIGSKVVATKDASCRATNGITT
jgi:hypothetical protein